MAITVDWANKIISVPQADLTFVSGNLYELDVDAFRLELKALEASEEGMPELDTHRHNTTVTISGVTYARTVEIINGYTVSFEDTGSLYRVRLAGANNNLADVTNFHGNFALIPQNSAGLVIGGAAAAAVWAYAIGGTPAEDRLKKASNLAGIRIV